MMVTRRFFASYSWRAALGAWAVGMLCLAGVCAQEAPESADDPKAKAIAFIKMLQDGKLSCPLDMLTDIPAVWNLTPDRLSATFVVPKGVELGKNPYFQWMTTDRTRAVFLKHPFSNLEVDLTLFGGEIPVEPTQKEHKKPNTRSHEHKKPTQEAQHKKPQHKKPGFLWESSQHKKPNTRSQAFCGNLLARLAFADNLCGTTQEATTNPVV